ncbi:hypothetical protein D8674_027389 [Pyrus ussuriensis x Pyrus communis]|uniref:PB1-like domain-containing protein n=1 Tax=Pyrus ussuriensis x Pyrus communis TaxID=2448454 RepID=A0A5N5I9K6_9ROSA|nr:hypothetical protein D8674_027389 [Pyrus ussuriensis x Pyrus communis]
MPELFSLKINHGGKWSENAYTRGFEAWFDYVDKDFMSFFDIDEMVKELGYDGFILYHYRIPYVPRTREIELYLEHLSPKQAALKHKLLMNLYESGTFKKGGNGSKLNKGKAKGATEGGQGSGDKVEDGLLNADNEGDENEEGHEAEEVNEGAELEANEEDDIIDSEFVDSDYSLEDDDRRAIDDTVVESVIRDAERGEGVENQHLEEVIDARDVEDVPLDDERQDLDDLHSVDNLGLECDKKVIYHEFNEDDPKIYNEDLMQVKTHVGKHERLRIWRENPNCKVAWLVKRYVDKFRLNPNMPITTFMKTVKVEIMTEIHLKTAYKVRAQCLEILDGSNVDQYTKLWEYCDELRRTNSGTTIQMKVIYICLGACKNGFKNGCRQLVGWMVWEWMQITKLGLLHMLKNKDSCVWFLELLVADLGIVNQRGWTFIPDKQKGLILAFEKASTSKASQPSKSSQSCTREAPQPSSQPTQASQTTSKSTARGQKRRRNVP